MEPEGRKEPEGRGEPQSDQHGEHHGPGQRRETLLGWFPDGDNAWLIVASFGGNAKNPAWYHNLAAHPDQVEIEVRGRKVKVTPAQLAGAEREAAWQRITTANNRYAGYATKTDREIPIIRLTAA